MLPACDDDELGGDPRAWDIYGAWTQIVNRDATEAEYRVIRRIARMPHPTPQIVAFIPYAHRRGHAELEAIAEQLGQEPPLEERSAPAQPPAPAPPLARPLPLPGLEDPYADRFEAVIRPLLAEFGHGVGGDLPALWRLPDEEVRRYVELRRAGRRPLIRGGQVMDPEPPTPAPASPDPETTAPEEAHAPIDPDDIPFL